MEPNEQSKYRACVGWNGAIIVELSSAIGVEHWPEVADRLDAIAAMLAESAFGDVNVSVETIVEFKSLPGGERTHEPLVLSGMAITALAGLQAELEFTIARTE